MKTIYLVRHADASQNDPALDDIERPLTKKGKKDSKLMGRELKKTGNVPKLLISSPAARAIETAGIFAERFSIPVNKIMVKNVLYESNAGGIITMLQKLNDKYDSVMLFGHNPAISETAKELVKGFSGNLEKTEVVCISVNRKKWENVIRKQGNVAYKCTLDDLLLKQKDREKEKGEIHQCLSQAVKNCLGRRKVPSSEALDRYIDEVIGRITKKAVKAVKNTPTQPVQ